MPLNHSVMKQLFFLLLPTFILSACNNTNQTPVVESDNGKPVKIDLPERIGYYLVDGDSLIIPPFDVTLDLSPKAEKELHDTKESVIVAAYFTGTPRDKNSPEIGDDGEFYMAQKDIELMNERTAYFRDIKISRSRYDSLDSKDIYMLINVYSGRRASQYNILSTDILSDSMSKIQNGHFTMKGKLIKE